MRTLALAAALVTSFAGLATSAHAADVIVDPVPPVVPVVEPAFSWTGIYIGVEAGYADASFDNVSVDATGAALTGTSREALLGGELDGFVGGVFLGANVELGGFVLGAEVAVDYADLTSERTGEFGFGPETVRTDIDVLAAARLRAGYAFGRILPYVAGGLSFASFETRYTNVDTFFGGFFFDEFREDTATGYNIGGGVEFAATDRIIVRADYRYHDFDERIDFLNEQTFSTELTDIHQTTLGVAFKF